MLGELVAEAGRTFGDTPAFVAAEGWELSFTELDRLSGEVAAGLRRRGVREGDVLGLITPPVPEYVVAYVAAAKVGAVATGVNPRLSPPEREKLLEIADPKLVLATAELMPDRWPSEEVVRTEDLGSVLAGLREPDGESSLVPDDPERPIAIVFTSGTTGLPKGAVFCNRQLAAVTSIDVGSRWGGGGRALASTPLAHLGPMTKLPGNLQRGVTTHMTDRWRADQALEFVARHRGTNIGGIPTQVALMLRVPRFEEYDLSSLRAIMIGGGPATPALVREARQRFHAPLAVRYSCTEAAVGIGTALDDPPEDAEETVGRPLAGVSLAVLDGEDLPVAGGQVGSICLKSAAVMSGYYRDPKATAEAFTAETFVRTGDVGWVDEKGRLHLAGRTKEMYVRGGYNVYPVEVEAVLSQHPAVEAVAVVAVPDPVMGEIGVAVVVPRSSDLPVDLADLREFAGPMLARHKLPEDLVVAESLPLTSMDKLDRDDLTEAVKRRRAR